MYFDISPFELISQKRLMNAINFVGADKVVFGTDTPYGGKNGIRTSIQRIKNIGISNSDKNLILGENMKRLHWCPV